MADDLEEAVRHRGPAVRHVAPLVAFAVAVAVIAVDPGGWPGLLGLLGLLGTWGSLVNVVSKAPDKSWRGRLAAVAVVASLVLPLVVLAAHGADSAAEDRVEDFLDEQREEQWECWNQLADPTCSPADPW